METRENIQSVDTPKGKRKKKHIFLKTVCAVLALLLAFDLTSTFYKSDTHKVLACKTTNPYILQRTDISGHRSGGGIEPEETMMAFKNCAESTTFEVNVFEFDLHMTKDNVLVLLHDDTVDRTSDSEEVFGEKDVNPINKTYDELRTLNMGAKFENEKGETPYADLKGDQVPDELKILRVEDVLDYLIKAGNGEYKYIIEIKNEGDVGKKGVDLLHRILVERNLVDKVVFGTFHNEVSEYVDTTYPDMTRSASIPEVLDFWKAAINDDKDYKPPCKVLQIPYCAPYKEVGLNLGTATVVNYAHSHDMAVQYWTVNSEKDMEYLLSLGADCIMTDYPDRLYTLENEMYTTNNIEK